MEEEAACLGKKQKRRNQYLVENESEQNECERMKDRA